LDILGLLNNYIKSNNNESQLAREFVTLLNNGQTLEKIAIKYDLPQEKIKEIIQKIGYIFNKNKNLWEYTEILRASTKFGTEEEIYTKMDIKEDDEKKVNNQQNRNKTISSDTIANLLNDGIEIGNICDQYDISSEELHHMLLIDGYNHFTFMNYWTRMTKQELSEYLVNELNKGITIYDLSEKYLKGNKDRINFVIKFEHLLKQHNYILNNSNNRWTKISTTQIPDIKIIIEELNSGMTIKNVCEKYSFPEKTLKQTLNVEKYKYDRVFMVWTKGQRKSLVKELANDLLKRKVTFQELKNKGLNVKLLEVELEFNGYKHILDDKSLFIGEEFNEKTNLASEQMNESKNPFQSDKSLSNCIENQQNSEMHKTNHIKNEKSYVGDHHNENVIEKQIFNRTDLTRIKEMIEYWKLMKKEKESIKQEPVKLCIFIDPSILSNLNKFTEIEGLSRSLVIEKALINYFNI
jgi:uncharacterized protein (DUF433 family)